MRYFRLEAPGKTLRIFPIVCWHLGANQCDLKFIHAHIKRIASDPNNRWVYLGDGGECVTTHSKGEIYNQRLSPDEQLETLAELLEPVRGQGLFGVSGNHDRRIAKLSGLDWTHALCSRLGIPYMGVACFARFIVNKVHYDTFWHHGIDSSSNLGGKLNKAKQVEQLVATDAVFTAHSHICLDAPPSYVAYLPPSVREIRYREVRNYICGCAYDSRVPGYAEEKGYSPILPAHLAVTFEGFNNHNKGTQEARKQTCEIWRAPA